MKTYEYVQVSFSKHSHVVIAQDAVAILAQEENFIKMLNRLGKQGWLLVSAIIDTDGDQRMFLMRPLQ